MEACALIDRLGVRGEAVLVLPGSHTKFVSVGADGRIAGCLTTITGELLASIMHDTIIADSVKRTFVEADTYRREMGPARLPGRAGGADSAAPAFPGGS